MGTVRIDNRKFGDQFGKAKFPQGEEVESLIGHPIGGVCLCRKRRCRFSLTSALRLDPVYPAAGAPNNAVCLSLADLEQLAGHGLTSSKGRVGGVVEVCTRESLGMDWLFSCAGGALFGKRFGITLKFGILTTGCLCSTQAVCAPSGLALFLLASGDGHLDMVYDDRR
ncbi:MAG: hypothetical protein ACLSHC_08325 [Bilophila wadsworthia]